MAHPSIYLPQDDVAYLVLVLLVLGALALNLSDDAKPLWHTYAGSWAIALGSEIALLVCYLVSAAPTDVFAKIHLILQSLRIGLLFCAATAGAYFAWSDSRRRIMLEESDDTTDSLLASDEDSDESDDENAYGFDEETSPDEVEDLRALRKQQLRRVKKAGSWFNYLKAYHIFVPILWPSGNRMVQASVVVAILTIAAERALQVLVPMQLGALSEELAVGAGNGQIPWRSIGLWMLFAALNSQAGLPMVQEIIKVPIMHYTRQRIMTAAFSHIMNLSMDYHNQKSSGELIRVVELGSELQELLDFLCFNVLPVFTDLLVALVYVYFLFDIYMALIVFCTCLTYAWIGAKVSVWTARLLRDHNTTMINESRIQNEAISCWAAVSQFNRTKLESERYSMAAVDHRKAAIKYYLAWSFGGGAQSFAMNAGHLAATTLAAYRVAQGYAPVRKFVTFAAYWLTIEIPMSEVTYSVRKITQMLINSERLLELMTTKPSVVDAEDATELVVKHGEVNFNNVDFAYDPRKPTIKGMSFTAKPGQTIAFVGETGGGKSTTLKLLYRYFDVNAGQIYIDGQDISTVTLDSLRSAFAFVPQDPVLFNYSIRENLLYARLDATHADIEAACRAAALHDKIMCMPEGYATTVGERGVKLSGGELQRLAIARAILREAPIVLLDEATSMIDAETEALVQSALKNLTQGRTTFVVAHRLSTIRHADCILVIKDGQIVERGSHEELLRVGGTYTSLCQKQYMEVKEKPLLDL
ncbi:ABC transporter [Apiospora arundinis]|uniref:ABC transporter n=1 Tax=Apiospora arundinis TaxID=335852 RepID=A0ABR2HPA3_9PEZI